MLYNTNRQLRRTRVMYEMEIGLDDGQIFYVPVNMYVYTCRSITETHGYEKKKPLPTDVVIRLFERDKLLNK